MCVGSGPCWSSQPQQKSSFPAGLSFIHRPSLFTDLRHCHKSPEDHRQSYELVSSARRHALSRRFACPFARSRKARPVSLTWPTRRQRITPSLSLDLVFRYTLVYWFTGPLSLRSSCLFSRCCSPCVLRVSKQTLHADSFNEDLKRGGHLFGARLS